ncbi:hypothetical protein [Sphingomonas prati]|uniref:Uncharacterized protein n=1 Tax=Sphingomonas prati TaxID=1843237 RepID=A0A7W9F0Y8_9SPHN|nr:hypothetical protein [Sphingomonas prati]MBB5728733.1 hypothetical protein [Sphingomonas prati]GGE87960.1 hypothetical protein GCM10011404_20990 [Sphingomonas prati]
MDDPRNRLADPDYAAFAWGRYRRLMRWMLLAAAVAIAAALFYLHSAGAPFTIALVVSTIAGVGGVVLLGAALMGLAFLSSGSGHDADAAIHEDET